MVTPIKKRSFLKGFSIVYFMTVGLIVLGTIVGFAIVTIATGGLPAKFLALSYWLTWFGLGTVFVSLLILLGWVLVRQWRQLVRQELDYACLSGVISGTLLAMASSLGLAQDQKFTSTFFIEVGGLVLIGVILGFLFGDKLPD